MDSDTAIELEKSLQSRPRYSLFASEFTHVVSADTTDTEALRQIGAEQFDRAVVGIGTDIEASVLTVLSLVELGVSEVWAKAINAKHARLLERVGATHVVRPESAMGERVAHMVTGAMIDYIESNFAGMNDIDRQLIVLAPSAFAEDRESQRALGNEAMHSFTRLIAAGVALGDVNTHFSPEMLAAVVVGTLNMLTISWALDSDFPVFAKLEEARGLFEHLICRDGADLPA